ncbi:MAG: hypothetical protein DMG93_01310 [Acidobacteria bacterium]|nr:MAG: hypothetical protein DMG93_01310 [Acidobacteriota bacterium]
MESNNTSVEKEEFDDFFSNPAFRSGYFIVATIACVSATLYNLAIILRHWRTLGTGDAPLLLVMAVTLIGFLWISLAQHSYVRQLYKAGSISDVRPGAPLFDVLRVAAKTTNNMLFFGSLAAASLLFVIDQLLSRT